MEDFFLHAVKIVLFAQKNAQKKYHKMYITTVYRTQNNVRNSREIYSNLPEKIQAIKEKYKNGIPKGELEKWLKIN